MRRAVAIAFVVLVAAGACSDKPRRVAIPADPTTSILPRGQGAAAYVESGDYVNGQHMARLTSFDDSNLTFDVVQNLTGDAAKSAYRADTGEELEIDYYIRNQNTRLRTLPVSGDVVIYVNIAGGYEPSDDHLVNPQTFRTYMDEGKLEHAYFWLRIRDGRIVRIGEQYLP
jgi:hypothetical protein